MKRTSRSKANLDFMEVFKDSFSRNVEDLLKGKIPKPPKLQEGAKSEQRRNGRFFFACQGIPGANLNPQTQFVKNDAILETSRTNSMVKTTSSARENARVKSPLRVISQKNNDVCEEIKLFENREDLEFDFGEEGIKDDPNDKMDVDDDNEEIMFDDRKYHNGKGMKKLGRIYWMKLFLMSNVK